MDFDLIRWKNADAVKVQRYAKAPENYYFFFSSFFRDALTILFFHFVSLSHFFFSLGTPTMPIISTKWSVLKY